MSAADDLVVMVERDEDNDIALVVIESGTSGSRYELHVSLSSGSVIGHDGCRGYEMRGDCRHAKRATAEVSERGWITPEYIPDEEAF